MRERSLVDHDMLKLEVRRLRGLLNSQADAVFSLENRKQQLKASMEERRLEAEVHRWAAASCLAAFVPDESLPWRRGGPLLWVMGDGGETAGAAHQHHMQPPVGAGPNEAGAQTTCDYHGSHGLC
jgi:hypothetical protein